MFIFLPFLTAWISNQVHRLVPSVHFKIARMMSLDKSDQPLPCIPQPQLKHFSAHHCPRDKVHTLTYDLQDLTWSNPCILPLTFSSVVPSLYNISQSLTSISLTTTQFLLPSRCIHWKIDFVRVMEFHLGCEIEQNDFWLWNTFCWNCTGG